MTGVQTCALPIFQHREAHYTCHMAVSDPQGIIRASSEAECHGRIRPQEAGSNGFGYDPLFEILEYHLTFGQLGPGVKSVLKIGRASCRDRV